MLFTPRLFPTLLLHFVIDRPTGYAHQPEAGFSGLKTLLLIGLTSIISPHVMADCGTLAGSPQCSPGQYATSLPSADTNSSRSTRVEIDPINQNLYVRNIDYESENSPLQLTRHYNSNNRQWDLGLGAGWQFGVQTRLLAVSVDSVTLVSPSGRKIVFRTTGGRTYEAADYKDGRITVDNSHVHWTDRQNRVYRFKGPLLVGIQDSGGNTSLVYDEQRLSKISHSDGESIFLFYEDHNGTVTDRIERIVTSKGQKVNFNYEKGNLVSTVDDGQPIHQYRYSSHIGTRLLTAVEREEEKLFEVNYDPFGKPDQLRDHVRHLQTDFQFKVDNQNAKLGTTRYTRSVLDTHNREQQTTNDDSTVSGSFHWKRSYADNIVTVLSTDTAICPSCKSVTNTYSFNKKHQLIGFRGKSREFQWSLNENRALDTLNIQQNSLQEKQQSLTVTNRDSNDNIIEVDSSRYGKIQLTYAADQARSMDQSSQGRRNFTTPASMSNHINQVNFADESGNKKFAKNNLSGLYPTMQLDNFRAMRVQAFVADTLLALQVDHHARSADSCTLNQIEDPNTSESDLEQSDQNCSQSGDDDNQYSTTEPTPGLPGGHFLDVRTSQCTSYFDTFSGIRRGSEIERAMSLDDFYVNAISTVRWFPAVDFIDGREAVSQVSRDLTSRTYNQPGALLSQIMREGRAMHTRFLQPLEEEGVVSASDGSQTTTIHQSDIDGMVFELVIQHGVVTESQVQQIHAAAQRLEELYGIDLRVLEIP